MSLHQKYHMLRLAEGLVRNNNLDTIYSPYPKNMILSSYNIPKHNLKSLHIIGALRYLLTKIEKKSLDEKVVFMFDALVSRILPKASNNGIFHGLNVSCKSSLERAKKLGYCTFVERSCPHEDFEYELLKDEYRRLQSGDLRWSSREAGVRMVEEYKLADYIVVPSSYSQRSFLERGFNPKKILVVPLTAEKVVKIANHQSRPTGKFKVLCVGGNFYRKGIYYLLKAWEALQLEDAELVIKGYLPEEFSNLSKIKNVTFISTRISDEEIIRLYQTSHVFVLPSIDDGFGMVVAEAMSTALPVIITENVGIADSIENGKEGFVVPIRDIEAIKDKIKFFYDHPEKIMEMGQAALKKSDFYTSEAYTQRMATAYQGVL